MHGCNKELTFLEEEQEKIKKQDWSDRMVDPPDTRRQYEVRTMKSEQWKELLSSLRDITILIISLVQTF